MKRVLMVAYHFPPLAGSSGIQRTLRFVQHLPAFGWEPIVLTADPRAYELTRDDLMRDVPETVPVERAFALDSAKHLSLFNRYPGFLACPDRWMTWKWGAVPVGMSLIRRYRPAAIWSTYPIATAHAIGAALQRRSDLPWIADFRDPMISDGAPQRNMKWRSVRAIEEAAIRQASRCVFVTPGAARIYRERYPELDSSRAAVIENGYDEESFAGAERAAGEAGPLSPGATTFLHSGIVYPSERDPTQLLQALAELKQRGDIHVGRLRIRFRAAVHERELHELVRYYAVGEMVEILPPIAYRDALEEMCRAEALLVMQASNCNEQIPAKIYEYFRARRPILGLTDPAGDTAGALRAAGIDAIAPLDSAPAIAQVLTEFLHRLGRGEAAVPSREAVERCSRASRSMEFAALLDKVAAER